MLQKLCALQWTGLRMVVRLEMTSLFYKQRFPVSFLYQVHVSTKCNLSIIHTFLMFQFAVSYFSIDIVKFHFLKCRVLSPILLYFCYIIFIAIFLPRFKYSSRIDQSQHLVHKITPKYARPLSESSWNLKVPCIKQTSLLFLHKYKLSHMWMRHAEVISSLKENKPQRKQLFLFFDNSGKIDYNLCNYYHSLYSS